MNNQRHKTEMTTIFCSVFGSFQPHPWLTSEVFTEVIMDGEFEDEHYRAFRVRPELITHPPFMSDEDAVDISEDAYGLFMGYAAELGWSSFRDDRNLDLWGMNEANIEWIPGDAPSHIAWFQVGAAQSTIDTHLPIQPIVMCAREVLNRLGELTLTGTQIMLPLPLNGEPRWRSGMGGSWFNLSDPAARAPVRITLDSGFNDDAQRKAADIFEMLRQQRETGWTFDSYGTAKPSAPPLEANIAYNFWMGDGHHTMNIEATAPEWNLYSAGWVTELCADACRAVGVDSTVLVSVTNQA